MEKLSVLENTISQFSWDASLEILLEPSTWEKYETFKKVFEHPYLIQYSNNQKEIFNWIHTEFIQAITEVTLKLYWYANKTKDFKPIGKERITDNFIRVLFQIPQEEYIPESYYIDLKKKLTQIQKKFHLSVKKMNKNKELIRPYIQFGTKKILLASSQKINDFFQFMGFSERISTMYRNPNKLDFVLGDIDRIPGVPEKFEDYIIFLQKTEIIRTANYTLSIIANRLPNKILLREIVSKSHFENEWKIHLKKKNVYDEMYIHNNMKKKAIHLYNSLDSEFIEELFYQETNQSIIYHEIGHAICKKLDYFTIKEASLLVPGLSKYNVLIAINEALADWAPVSNGISGPIIFFANAYKDDPQKAKRMLYAYMSDCWFLDSKDEYFYILTDVLLSLALPFIQDDSSIDFDKILIKQELIYKFLIQESKFFLNELDSILQNAIYERADGTLIDYNTLEKEQITVFLELEKSDRYPVREDFIHNPEKFKEDHEFWNSIFESLRENSDSFPLYIETIQKFTDRFYKQTLNFVKEELYKGPKPFTYTTLREYVILKSATGIGS